MAELLPPSVAFLLGNIEDFKAKWGEAAAISEETDSKLAKAGEIGKKAFLGIGLAVGAVAIEALKLSTVFDATMARINTQDNAGLTIKQMKDLKSSVLDLAGPTAQAPEALAEAMVHVYGSGLKGAQALDLLKVAAQGATTGHANLVDVTNALDAAVAVGIKGTGDYKAAMGELNATVGAGDMTMQNLAEALGGPMLATVKGYGLSITDVGAALAVFGDRNIRGSEAATELRMAVQALAVPAATGGKALESIGLSTTSLRKDLLDGGLNKALNDLNDHLLASGYNSQTAGSLITQAFGKKAGGGLNVLMDSLASSTSNFNQKFVEITKSGQTFAEDWAQTQDTLQYKLKSLGAAAEAEAIKFGEFLTPKVGSFLDMVQRDGPPALEKFGKAIAAALNSPGAHQAADMLRATWADVAHAFKDGVVAAENLLVALQPTAAFLGGVFLTGLRTAGSVLVILGDGLRALTGFLRDNAGMIKLVAEVVLPVLIARYAYLKTLTAIDMFTNFVTGIGKAVTAMGTFASSVKSGQIFDEIRLKAMYAGDAVKGLATRETEAAAAAEANAGSRGFGAFAGKLATAVPVIGAVTFGAVMLGQKLGQLAGVGDHTGQSITNLTKNLLDMNAGLPGSATNMQGLVVQLAEAGRKLHEVDSSNPAAVQGMKDLDAAVAKMVSDGNITGATQAFTQMQEALVKQGFSLGYIHDQLFPQYNKALTDASNATRENTVSASDLSTVLDGVLTSALSGAKQAAADLKDGLNAVDEAYTTLTGHLNESGILHTFEKDLLDVKGAVQQNGKAFDETSLKGLANMEAYRQAMVTIIQYKDESIKNGTVQRDVADKTAAAQIAALQKTWEQAGVSKKQIDAYTTSLGGIPTAVSTTVNIKQAGYADVAAKLDALNVKREALGQPIILSAHSAIRAAATGGLITGPGSSTSDSIPTRLSNGEYVIQAASVARFGTGFLDMINSGNLSAARGALGATLTMPSASGPAEAAAGGGTGDVAVTVYVQAPGQPGWKETKAIRTEVLRYQNRNTRNGLSLPGIAS